jgi:alpha-tubulin suppressor-like RCC1 family protein
MNALVKKEIRLLLPNFGFACVLALGGVFIPANNGDNLFFPIIFILSCVICPAAMVMLALSSFGVEVGSGTFSNLLSQPVPRMKLWQTKFTLLAAALLSVAFLWMASFIMSPFHLGQYHSNQDWLDLFATVTVIGLVIFSGGLWTVLLLRQVAAAFWFTVLVPGVILVILAGLLADQSDTFSEGMLVIVFGLYSLAGIFLARWLFLRAQDVAWTGGTIALPDMRGLKWWGERPRQPQAVLNIGSSGALRRRRWHPRAALFWKELQLHQSQFIMAGVLLLLHLGVLAMRKFGHYQKNSSTEFILEIFWLLWLVMPLLVGAAAVAEERKLGTLAGQFCLPVKRRTLFTIKFRIAMLLSVLLGVAMPLLLEGSWIMPDVHFLPSWFHFESDYLARLSVWQFSFWHCLEMFNVLAPLLLLLGLAATIGAVSFYTSTLSRNTLQALAPSVLGLVLAFMLNLMLIGTGNYFNHLLGSVCLIYFIGVPVLSITLVAMSFKNFQRPNLGWPAWVQNALVFAAALVFVYVTTTAVYHRAWEKLTPFEPPHGAARFTQANPPTLNNQWSSIYARLSDGRIWEYKNAFYPGIANPLTLLLGYLPLTSQGSGHFLEGSNWVSVRSAYRNESVGLKSDGSIWVSGSPLQIERLAGGGYKVTPAGGLTRFGSETNWSSIAPHGLAMLLVKNDGTLWSWGILTHWNLKIPWPGLRTFTPQRLGTATNWAEVFSAGNQACLRKTDGSVWDTWNQEPGHQRTDETEVLEPNFSVQRDLLYAPDRRSSTTIGRGWNSQLAVGTDGIFRIIADQKMNRRSHSYEWATVNLPFSSDTNWLAVAGNGEKFVTLKDDGSLWLWDFRQPYWRRDETYLLAVKPTRLGTHSDWLAIADTSGGIISLAADGSLWFWPLDSAAEFFAQLGGSILWDNNNQSQIQPLLDISRKPRLMGNIFSQGN